jgi:hypothetical protein
MKSEIKTEAKSERNNKKESFKKNLHKLDIEKSKIMKENEKRMRTL